MIYNFYFHNTLYIATNLRLADIVTAFRNINECYRNIRSLGTDGFGITNTNNSMVPLSVLENNNKIILEHEKLFPFDKLSILQSPCCNLLQTILTYWYSINDNIKLIEANQDLSVLRYVLLEKLFRS